MTLIHIDLTGAKPKPHKPLMSPAVYRRKRPKLIIPDFELPKPRTKSQRNAERSQRPNWPY